MGSKGDSRDMVTGQAIESPLKISRKHVLVVDDEADIRELLKFNLEQEGYSVETSENGEQALQALKTQRLAMVPDGRYASAREVAQLMVYLASDWSSHITGEGVHINGGQYS